MRENNTALGSRAFGENADNLTVIKYKSHHDAMQFLHEALRSANGVGLLCGPKGAGRSTIARELALQSSTDSDVAYVDGRQLKPNDLLTRMVRQFGIETTADADDELLRVVTDFTREQTSSWQAPILIIDNADRMYPSTLRILNTLAALSIQGRYTLRLALTGNSSIQALVQSNSMASLVGRAPMMHTLKPLSAKETMLYLHARLQAAGSERSDTIFPFDVCDRLREQSGGWPGKLNHYAFEAIKRSDGFPVSVDSTYESSDQAPSRPGIPVLGKHDAVEKVSTRLIVSRDGKTLAKHAFTEKKMLLGRSDFADIIVDDDYVSKIHAVFLLYADALVMLDLNSANGTTVNSRRVRKTILKDGDIISLGNHRLKVENAPAIDAGVEKLLKAPDTIKMKNLVDLRRQRAQRRMRSKNKRRG